MNQRVFDNILSSSSKLRGRFDEVSLIAAALVNTIDEFSIEEIKSFHEEDRFLVGDTLLYNFLLRDYDSRHDDVLPIAAVILRTADKAIANL